MRIRRARWLVSDAVTCVRVIDGVGPGVEEVARRVLGLLLKQPVCDDLAIR
jgi:hypothetical protein